MMMIGHDGSSFRLMDTCNDHPALEKKMQGEEPKKKKTFRARDRM